MSIHIYLIIIVISSAIIIYNNFIFVSKSSILSYNNSFEYHHNTIKIHRKNNIFIFLCLLVLSIIAGFRGDFNTDYKNYVSLYRIVEYKTFYEVLTTNNSAEILFAMMNKLISIIFNDYIFVFITSAFITIYFTFKEIKKHSEYVWISVLIFVCIGSYFVSFNLMRQVMAAAMIFGSSKYLYKRQFIKYLLCIILTSLFHKSAVIMLPFYFILNLKWNKNIVKIISPIYIMCLFYTYLFAPQILNFIRRFFYSNYLDTGYGISTGLGIETIFKPLIVILYIFYNYKLINLKNIHERIWFNASIYYFLFSLIGLKVEMIQRFHHFFSLFILLIIPLIISRKKTKESKIINILMVILFLVSYSLYTMGSNYYFLSR